MVSMRRNNVGTIFSAASSRYLWMMGSSFSLSSPGAEEGGCSSTSRGDATLSVSAGASSVSSSASSATGAGGVSLDSSTVSSGGGGASSAASVSIVFSGESGSACSLRSGVGTPAPGPRMRSTSVVNTIGLNGFSMFPIAPTSSISSSLTLLRVLVKTRRGTWEKSGFSRRRRQKSKPSEFSMSRLATTMSGGAFSAISRAASASSAICISTLVFLKANSTTRCTRRLSSRRSRLVAMCSGPRPGVRWMSRMEDKNQESALKYL